MLVAIKDDLTIQVTVFDHKVNIAMPGMEDIIWLWNSWIQDEERSAEKYLRSQYIENPYPLLSDYFEKKGWEITEIRHQN